MRKILIMGLPGAGKTTLATTLAPLLNAVVFNADAVRDAEVAQRLHHRLRKMPVKALFFRPTECT